MIIDFEIEHRAETRVRGKVEPRWYKATIPISLTEADACEAPVAAWWSAPGDKARVAVRSYDEALWQPILAGDTLVIDRRGSDVSSTHVAHDVDGFVAKPARGKVEAVSGEGLSRFLTGKLSGKDDENRLMKATGMVLAEDKSVKETLWSDLDARTASLQATVAKYASFNGIAHRRISHPMIEYETSHWGGIGTTTANQCKDPGRTYPITRHKEAVRLYLSQVERRVDKRSLKWLEPEIVDASLLAFDMPRWMARTLGSRIVRSLSRNHNGFSEGSEVSHLSKEGMRAFYHLREAVKADETAETLYGRLRDLDEASGIRKHLDPHHRTCETVLDRLKAEIDAAVEPSPMAARM